MNVLIYSGPGTSALSVQQVTRSLRRCLGKLYDIKTVDAKVVREDPWETGCALFVIPGGEDLPYLDALGSLGVEKIRNWVNVNAGRYLGICAGAYFASSFVKFDEFGPLKIVGERPLSLFPDSAIGPLFPGFQYHSHEGALATRLTCHDNSQISAYYNGGCYFHNAETIGESVKVLARYNADQAKDQAAVVLTQTGIGKALLCGVHLEYEAELLRNEEISANILEILEKTQDDRLNFFKLCLSYLDLKTSIMDAMMDKNLEHMVSPLRYYSIDSMNLSQIIPAEIVGEEKVFKIEKEAAQIDPDSEVYPIIQAENLDAVGEMSFSPDKYFAQLKTKSLGRNMFYAEKIMSTQTLLSQNPKLMNKLPSGFMVLAGDQLAGKGRGKNTWLSSNGCLQFTFIIDHLGPSALCLVQYLVALSMAEAINDIPGLSQGEVCLKWPNDIYARTHKDGQLKKIGGILVTSESARDNRFRLLVGFGINIYDTPWSLCLRDLFDPEVSPIVTKELILAKFFNVFEEQYDRLILTQKFPFETYYKHWLHSNELVFLKDENVKVKIEGIDQNGYLVAKPVVDGLFSILYPIGSQNVYLLQPDGNSFDMMRELIHRK